MLCSGSSFSLDISQLLFCPIHSQCVSLSTEFPGTSLWIIELSFWPLLRLAEEILLLGLPLLTFTVIVCLWNSNSYSFLIVNLFSDHYASLDKAQGPIYIWTCVPTYINIQQKGFDLPRVLFKMEFFFYFNEKLSHHPLTK